MVAPKENSLVALLSMHTIICKSSNCKYGKKETKIQEKKIPDRSDQQKEVNRATLYQL